MADLEHPQDYKKYCPRCGGETMGDGTVFRCNDDLAETASGDELNIAEGRDPDTPCRYSLGYFPVELFK